MDRAQMIGETGGTWAYSDSWSVWRDYRDGRVVRGGWLRYGDQVRVFDTEAEARRVADKLATHQPNTIAGRHVRFWASRLPLRTYEAIKAGTYRPAGMESRTAPAPELWDWAADEPNDGWQD